MWFDRFDIVSAHFLFLSDYHEGQWSDKYLRLCRLAHYFSPGHGLDYSTLSENGQAIYDNLVARESPF